MNIHYTYFFYSTKKAELCTWIYGKSSYKTLLVGEHHFALKRIVRFSLPSKNLIWHYFKKKETKIILWASPCRAWKRKLKWKWIYTTTSYCTKSTNCNCHMKVLLLLSPPTSLGCPYHLSYLFKKFLKPASFKKVIYNNTFTIIIRHIFDSFFINSLLFVRSYIISFRPLMLLQSGHPRS